MNEAARRAKATDRHWLHLCVTARRPRRDLTVGAQPHGVSGSFDMTRGGSDAAMAGASDDQVSLPAGRAG